MGLFDPNRSGRATQFGRIFPADSEWLSLQEPEETIEPDLPIIDTHHHLWVMPNDRYLCEEFTVDVRSGHKIVGTVYVECGSGYRTDGPDALKPVGETEFVVHACAHTDFGDQGDFGLAVGIVSHADLSLGSAVSEVLQAHLEVGEGRFRGIRFAAGWDDDETIGNSHTCSGSKVLRQVAVIDGLKCLAGMDLSFDAWVFHPQLDDVCYVADQLPGLNMILGHCGGPLGYGRYLGRQAEEFDVWKQSMTALAKRPNIKVKLGGMMMRLASIDYLSSASAKPPSSDLIARAWRPYIETCIELFGADRCMFESNFPVEKMGCNYQILWNAFKKITSSASASEKHALYSGTAKLAYRL